jgi:uncharacterized membrane protein
MTGVGTGDVSEVVSHTVVALVVLVGSFTMMVISVATGKVISDNVMTLLTVLTSSVVGWFFGVRSALSGVHAGQNTANVAPMPETAGSSAPTAGA